MRKRDRKGKIYVFDKVEKLLYLRFRYVCYGIRVRSSLHTLCEGGVYLVTGQLPADNLKRMFTERHPKWGTQWPCTLNFNCQMSYDCTVYVCVFICSATESTAFLGLVVSNLAVSRQQYGTIILSDFRQSRTVNVGSAVRNSFSTISEVWHLLSRFS
jgi:hypothetical protein